LLFLVAGVSALFCAGCAQPNNPDVRSYTVTFYKNDETGMVARDNTVYLSGDRVITIDGALDGTDPVAYIQAPAGPAWIGREVIKKSASFIGTLPADRFGFTGPWQADSDGKVQAKAGSLDLGETRSAFINQGEVHLYRFTPVPYKSYTITRTLGSSSYYVYVSAAWADGGTLVNRVQSSSGTSYTTSSFTASKSGVDIIIMVESETYAGSYTVKFNEL
jgi:hypothetical protein